MSIKISFEILKDDIQETQLKIEDNIKMSLL
jgi:hypothetical protein